MEENSSQCVYHWPRRRETDNASFLATQSFKLEDCDNYHYHITIMYSWSTGTVSTRELTTDKCPAIPTGKTSTVKKETLNSNMKTIARDMLTKSVPSSPFYHFFRVSHQAFKSNIFCCLLNITWRRWRRIYRVYESKRLNMDQKWLTENAHGAGIWICSTSSLVSCPSDRTKSSDVNLLPKMGLDFWNPMERCIFLLQNTGKKWSC